LSRLLAVKGAVRHGCGWLLRMARGICGYVVVVNGGGQFEAATARMIQAKITALPAALLPCLAIRTTKPVIAAPIVTPIAAPVHMASLLPLAVGRSGGDRMCSELVGVAGFEPAASSSRTKRAAKLRYTPPVRASIAPDESWTV
jgi:hypothetical protein